MSAVQQRMLQHLLGPEKYAQYVAIPADRKPDFDVLKHLVRFNVQFTMDVSTGVISIPPMQFDNASN
uniref:Uncharacterized protein n=1 Tax=Panagrellus redivivus TaxID=6233 RepID=A0A7E4UZI8_PANRE